MSGRSSWTTDVRIMQDIIQNHGDSMEDGAFYNFFEEVVVRGTGLDFIVGVT